MLMDIFFLDPLGINLGRVSFLSKSPSPHWWEGLPSYSMPRDIGSRGLMDNGFGFAAPIYDFGFQEYLLVEDNARGKLNRNSNSPSD